MARGLGPRHGEPHVCEQSPRHAFADVPLRVVVGRNQGGPENVELEICGQPAQLGGGHARILPRARRSHSRGRGPEVLRYEEIPDPSPVLERFWSSFGRPA